MRLQYLKELTPINKVNSESSRFVQFSIILWKLHRHITGIMYMYCSAAKDANPFAR